MAKTVVLKVGMSCEGCAGAVKRILTKMEQKVTMKGNLKPEDILQTVSKTGKETSFWEGEAEVKETAPDASAAAATATAA